MALTNAEKQRAYRLRKARQRAVEAGDASKVIQIDRRLRGEPEALERIRLAATAARESETATSRGTLEGRARQLWREVRDLQKRLLDEAEDNGGNYDHVRGMVLAAMAEGERVLREEFPLETERPAYWLLWLGG